MDWERFEREHPTLSWPPSAERVLDAAALLKIADAARTGAEFARREELPVQRLGEALEKICDGCDEHVAAVRRCAFLLGASATMGLPWERPNFVQMHFDVCAQRELTRALLHLSEQDRFMIVTQGRALLKAGSVDWPVLIAGPLAVARSVCAFLRQGWTVRLPTVDEDRHDKIDLLAHRKAHGFCLQVKSDRSSRYSGILMETLLHAPKGSAEDKKGTRASLWRGTARFNRRYGLAWASALLTVGTNLGPSELSVPLWFLEPTS